MSYREATPAEVDTALEEAMLTHREKLIARVAKARGSSVEEVRREREQALASNKP